MTTRRHLLRLAPFAAVLLLAPGLASAHARTERTVPPDGANLEATPQTIEMHFDKEVFVTVVEMRDMLGQYHPLDWEQGRSARKLVATPFDTLPNGGYIVHWRGLSSDGHVVTGSFEFTIG